MDIYKDGVDEDGLIDDNFIEEEVMNIENQKKLKTEVKKRKNDSYNPGSSMDEDFGNLEWFYYLRNNHCVNMLNLLNIFLLRIGLINI